MSNSLTDEVKKILAPAPDEKTLVITVGNTLRSDDGVGPFVADGVKSTPENIHILNVGDRPENSVDEAVDFRPDRTIVIDAADFGGAPGEVRNIPREAIPQTTLSTHTFPLPVITKMIEEESGSKVYFLGIQPLKVSLGEGLSPAVEEAAREIIKLLDKGD